MSWARLSPTALGLVAAVVTLLSGFGLLCYFWFFEDHPAGVPGLFDFRSATVGDALLLPTLVGALAAGAWALREDEVRHRGRLALAAGLAGLAVGVATQFVWLNDPQPEPNWTWPAAGEFTDAGIAHGIFLCLAVGATAYLLAFVLLTLRSRRLPESASPRQRAGGLPEPASVALITACAVALLGLILRDNGRAEDTVAGVTTAVAALVGVAILVGVASWAMGRKSLPGSVVGLAAAIGIVGFCYDWPPTYPDLICLSSAGVIGLAVFLSQPLWAVDRRLALTTGAAIALLLEGAVVFAAHRIIGSEELAGLAALVVAAAGAGLLPAYVCAEPELRKELKHDIPGAMGVSLYVAGTFALAGVVRSSLDGQQAVTAVNAAEFLFDLLVFSLFRARFRRLVEDEEAIAQSQDPPLTLTLNGSGQRLEERGQEGEGAQDKSGKAGHGLVASFSSLFAVALAVLLALSTLLGLAAGPLGIAEVAEGSDPSFSALAILAAIAILAAGIAAAGEWWNGRTGGPGNGSGEEINLSTATVFIALLACVLWASGPFLLAALVGQQDHNLELLALFPALVFGFLTAESLTATPVKLQLASPGWAGYVLAIAAGIAVLSASWWLFSVGIWSDGGPAYFWRAFAAVAVVLLGCFLLSLFVGRTLAFARVQGGKLTPKPPEANVVLDHGLYAFFMLLLAVVPISVIAYLAEASAGLPFISSLAFVPGMFGVFIWVTDNNRVHHDGQQALADPTESIWNYACQRTHLPLGQELETEAKNDLCRYKAAMAQHVLIQNWGASMALVGIALALAGYLIAS